MVAQQRIGTWDRDPDHLKQHTERSLECMRDFVKQHSVAGYTVEISDCFGSQYYHRKRIYYLVVEIEGFNHAWIDHHHRFTLEELIAAPQLTLARAWEHAEGLLPLPSCWMAL